MINKRMKKKIFLFGSMMALFLSFNIFLFYNQQRKYSNFYDFPISVVVKEKFNSFSGKLIIFEETDIKVNLYLSQEDMSLIVISDSIYKPSNSNEIFVYREEDSGNVPIVLIGNEIW